MVEESRRKSHVMQLKCLSRRIIRLVFESKPKYLYCENYLHVTGQCHQPVITSLDGGLVSELGVLDQTTAMAMLYSYSLSR